MSLAANVPLALPPRHGDRSGYGEPRTEPAPFCPNATILRPSCKRRDCPFCGYRWVRSWKTSLRLNLEAYGGAVALVSITAPGEDRLPWDRERCRHREGTRCSGKRGCRVQDRALREWAETLVWRWAKLRQAARAAVIRAGHEPPLLLERTWEPQKRGVPHLHLVLGYGLPRERRAAQAFADELARLAPAYDFGHVDRGKREQDGTRRLQAITGSDAARYLSGYLLGRSKRKGSIRENLADPHLPRALLWLTPKLTAITKVTIRRLRYAYWTLAAMRHGGTRPNIFSRAERRAVALVVRQLAPRAPPLDIGAFLAT